jgi:hypothetical protein
LRQYDSKPFFAIIGLYIEGLPVWAGFEYGAGHETMRWMSALIILPAVLVGGYALASSPATPTALAGLEPGQWDLRSRDPGEPLQRICVRDVQALLQLRHPGQNCSRFIVEDTPDRTSVTYTCPGTGHGRTVVRVETPRLVQIDSQGVADGYPFALDLEGRRTGACAPLAAKK